MKVKSILSMILGLLAGYHLTAGEPVAAVRASVRPVVDGRLDDPVWATLPRYTDFKSYMPDFGTDAAFSTTAMITFDEESIYIGFDCKDPEPGKIKATITARDQIKSEDWVCVNFDPFFDQQSLLAFYVNPFGIQADGRSSASHEDTGADYVFYSKAVMLPDGYQVEIQIPFKSIRYQKAEPVTMGFIFERRIQRLSQQSTAPPLNANQGMNFLTQTRPFTFSGIKHYTLLEFLPSLTYSFRQERREGQLAITDNHPSLGFTGTVGLTSQLILDVAVNPDFSQVESDAGQIEQNQRYALYYPEKRPFFQEGKSSFEVAGTSEMGFFQHAFHTRRIVQPLVGLKLTGKLDRFNQTGLLYSYDVNDSVHYAIGRYKRMFRDDSFIGAIATFREGRESSGRVAGVDGRWRLSPSVKLEVNALGSMDQGIGAEAGSDWMATAVLSGNTDRFSGDIQIQHIGENFDASSGFLMRSGVNNITGFGSYSFFLGKGFFKRIGPMGFAFLNHDIPSGLWERDYGIGLNLSGQHSTKISFFLNPSDEVYRNVRLKTHSFHFEAFSQPLKSVSVQTEYRFGYRSRYVENPYTGYGHVATASLKFQPWNRFYSEARITYSDFYHTDDREREFSYLIVRSLNTLQVTPKLFVRGIIEYDSYERNLNTDFLISFTYIPGTVIHAGYGSLFKRTEWDGDRYQPSGRFHEDIRGFFFKASYLWRN